MSSNFFLSRGFLNTTLRRNSFLPLSHRHQRLHHHQCLLNHNRRHLPARAAFHVASVTPQCHVIDDARIAKFSRRYATSTTASQKLQAVETVADPLKADDNQSATSSTTTTAATVSSKRHFEPLDPDPYFEKIDLTFSNTRECFRNKSTFELIRSILVFQVGFH